MKIGFIGVGNMGAALAKAASKKDGTKIYVCDRDESKARMVASELSGCVCDSDTVARECDYIFLGVKPNVIKDALAEIKDTVLSRPECVIISMAAGVKISLFESELSKNTKIIRIMPNLPVSVGKGMIVWSESAAVTEDDCKGFVYMLSEAGRLDQIDEGLIDAACAISGCGPAFVFMFIDALARGGEKCGLSRESAIDYAAQTLVGAATLLLETKTEPDTLRDAVCSPGGSTIEGVKSLLDNGFYSTVEGAVRASYEKTLKLSK